MRDEERIRLVLEQTIVVIPAFNEQSTIREVVLEVRRIVRRVVVVNDGSADDTASEAVAAGAAVLTHVVNLGQGAAIQTGIDYAIARGARYICTFDADGQHSADSIVSMAAVLIHTDSEVVLGSRWLGSVHDIPALRRWALRCAVLFTRVHTGLHLTDTHNGLRLIAASAARRLQLRQPGMAHASEILKTIARLKLKWAEAQVDVRYTEYSLAKGQSLTGIFKVLADLISSSWIRGWRE